MLARGRARMSSLETRLFLRFPRLSVAAGLAALAVVGCATEAAPPGPSLDFPSTGGKTDVFGRSLAGIAAPYEADRTLRDAEDRLRSDAAFRRATAWSIVARAADQVPLLGLAERAETHEEIRLPEGEVPRVPRFETWYGVDDFKRMFQHLYEALGEEGRAARTPFSETAIDEAFVWNAGALERSQRWPLDRYLRYVNQLGVCPEGVTGAECAALLQSNFSGGTSGNVRILYSPATIEHLLASYPSILRCLDELDTLGLDTPAGADNFTFCFEREFPEDAVLVKAQWVRAELERALPTYDTSAETIARHLSAETSGDWATGDRESDPGPDRIYTIRLLNGDVYRLAGLHIMTKETRHWMWITLWWSDEPSTDFGADRPALEGLHPVFQNYKMCVVADYLEGDSDPAARFEGFPTLAAALRAAQSAGPTWCSNPYVEHGRGNARTNCIGCHQHGGSTVFRDLDADGALDPFDLERVIDDEANFPEAGRRRIREVFPADYLWSLTRVDDVSHVIRSEVQHFDAIDGMSVPSRARRVIELTGDPAMGQTTFSMNCARCHGADGRGTLDAPSLYERVPMRDDLSLATTILGGRGTGSAAMPAWGARFDDARIAGLVAYLRSSFGAGM